MGYHVRFPLLLTPGNIGPIASQHSLWTCARCPWFRAGHVRRLASSIRLLVLLAYSSSCSHQLGQVVLVCHVRSLLTTKDLAKRLVHVPILRLTHLVCIYVSRTTSERRVLHRTAKLTAVLGQLATAAGLKRPVVALHLLAFEATQSFSRAFNLCPPRSLDCLLGTVLLEESGEVLRRGFGRGCLGFCASDGSGRRLCLCSLVVICGRAVGRAVAGQVVAGRDIGRGLLVGVLNHQLALQNVPSMTLCGSTYGNQILQL